MLTKLSTFRGVAADSGEPLVQVFHQGDSIQKVAGYYQPAVRDFLRTYKSDKNEIALLVNAMGGSEYWGQNVNGDVFPWDRLAHDCTGRDPESYPFDKFYGKKVRPYGFKTFLQAHPFAHHKNQDPTRAFGRVVVSCLNEVMKRVELVVIVERDKAEKFDASHIVSKIDSGKFPDVSMGCRIPYDVCTICGNKSRTKEDVCKCVTDLGLNYIFPDGRKVGLINLHPVFFDISFVFIGADRTAKVMEKLAGTGVIPSAIEAEYVYVCNNGRCGLEKRASVVPEHIIADAQVHDQGRGQTLLTKLRESHKHEDDFNALLRSIMRPLVEQLAERDSPDGTGPGDGQLHTNVHATPDDMSVEKHAGACCAGKETCDCKTGPDEVMDPNQQGPAGAQNNVTSSAIVGGTGEKTAQELALEKPPHRDEFPFQGKKKFRGLTILIENAAGTWRTGKGWATKMRNDYGEIEGSLGSDGDAVDVYLGPNEDARNVYIVHQNYVYGPKKGEYDEDKVMLGFPSAAEAKRVYLKHYDRPEFFRSITEMDFDQFKKLIFRKEGEKIAADAKEKTAEATVDLDSLFSHSNIVKRERLWKDRTKKKETYRVGSGLGDSFEKAKTAGVEVEPENVAEYLDSLFKTSGEKTADIVKEVEPDSVTGRVVEELSSREPKIDSKVLDKAGEKDLQKALATPAMMGMVLKPEEFQRILLSAIGKSDLADEFDEKGMTFKPTSESKAPCGELGPEHFDEDLMKDLLPMLSSRSYLGPVLQRRIVVLKITPKVSSSQPEESPLLSKVGAAYTWYRSEMVKCAAHAQQLVESHPAILQKVAMLDDSSFFTKTAADANTIGTVAASVPLMLMLSASYRGDEQRGEELGLVKSLIAKHPNLSALGVGALIREAMKHPELNKLVGEIASNAMGAGKRILVGGA